MCMGVLYIHTHLCVCECVCVSGKIMETNGKLRNTCSKYDSMLVFLLCSGEHQLNKRKRKSLAIWSCQEPLMCNTAVHWDHLGA